MAAGPTKTLLLKFFLALHGDMENRRNTSSRDCPVITSGFSQNLEELFMFLSHWKFPPPTEVNSDLDPT